MDRSTAEFYSKQLGIAAEQVVREELELAVLKGGTALRLAYGSPRFSDDLDFSALGPIAESEFKKASQAAARNMPEGKLIEALAKHYTLFAIFQFRIPYIGRPFSMKIEISIRKESWKLGRDFELKLLTSELTNITALAQVATLERMGKDKQKALKSRRQIRDIYDLWFISQKLGRDFEPDTTGIPPSILRRELRKYLPRSHWRLVDKWTA
jgi:predicted nucleotidyltransferase component of viral defense system